MTASLSAEFIFPNLLPFFFLRISDHRFNATNREWDIHIRGSFMGLVLETCTNSFVLQTFTTTSSPSQFSDSYNGADDWKCLTEITSSIMQTTWIFLGRATTLLTNQFRTSWSRCLNIRGVSHRKGYCSIIRKYYRTQPLWRYQFAATAERRAS